ncbi:MAG: hypothetical protein JWM62_1428 [Frankiales bacterium]|jgi:uncharacterized protein (DUF1697 family)|nr:hypothetical protein [Frankiales bacterium]
MTRVAVLLRAVNLGAHNRIAMPAFKAVLEGIGCTHVATYLQSGNAVVTDERDDLAGRVAQALRDELALSLDVLTRTAAELDAVVAANELDPDPKLLHVVFLRDQVDPTAVDHEELLPDRVQVGDRVLYVRYAAGMQNSQASKVLSRRQFQGVATARNWRTVLALQELARG